MSEENKISEELNKMDYEPLLPIEKKLILGSVILGVISLIVLVLVSRAFFN